MNKSLAIGILVGLILGFLLATFLAGELWDHWSITQSGPGDECPHALSYYAEGTRYYEGLVYPTRYWVADVWTPCTEVGRWLLWEVVGRLFGAFRAPIG